MIGGRVHQPPFTIGWTCPTERPLIAMFTCLNFLLCHVYLLGYAAYQTELDLPTLAVRTYLLCVLL